MPLPAHGIGYAERPWIECAAPLTPVIVHPIPTGCISAARHTVARRGGLVMGSVGRKFRWTTCAAVLALGVGAAATHGADAPTTDPSDLTSLSLEDLMNLEVTSVSKHRQKVSEAPAAVTVITQDDIQRSGLESIPELLRLAPGLDVARIDASQWGISSRGFNDLFANKMLVL